MVAPVFGNPVQLHYTKHTRPLLYAKGRAPPDYYLGLPPCWVRDCSLLHAHGLPTAHVTSVGLDETRGRQCPLYPEAGLLCNPGLTQATGVSLICFSLFVCLPFALTPQSYALWIRVLSNTQHISLT